MPYKDKSRRRMASAASMRRLRNYQAALASGDPRAVEADQLQSRARRAAAAFYALEDRLKAMDKAERAPFRAEYDRLNAERVRAMDDRAADLARARELRASIEGG